MDELFSKAFDRLTQGTPRGPEIESLVPGRNLDTSPGRKARPTMTVVGILGLVVAIALPLMWWAGRDESPPGAEEDMIPYVRIHWRVESEHECPEGLPIQDNGGFEEGVIEMWGPTIDGYLRVDATAPDGTVEQIVTYRLNPNATYASWEEAVEDAKSYRSWSTRDISSRSNSPFRILTCAGRAQTNGPMFPGNPPIWFVGVPRVGDAYTAGPSQGLPRSPGVWRGVQVSVVEIWKTSEGESLWWFDEHEGRAERMVLATQGWRGRSVETYEVVDRADIPAAGVSFATDHLVPTWFGAPLVADERPLLVPYTKLSWEFELELECDPEFDNHGFESATIEVYGPSPEGLFRFDATAPDGTVETVVTRGRQAQGMWRTYGDGGGNETVFRVLWCWYGDHVTTGRVGVGGTPIPVRLTYVTSSDAHLSDWLGQASPDLDSNAPSEVRQWRAASVSVYRARADGVTEEWWYDPVKQRVERSLATVDSPGYARWTIVISVIERSLMPVPDDFFSTEGLTSVIPDLGQ